MTRVCVGCVMRMCLCILYFQIALSGVVPEDFSEWIHGTLVEDLPAAQTTMKQETRCHAKIHSVHMMYHPIWAFLEISSIQNSGSESLADTLKILRDHTNICDMYPDQVLTKFPNGLTAYLDSLEQARTRL